MFIPLARQRFANDDKGFTETFRQQFLLLPPGCRADLPGWQRVEAAGWSLCHAPDLPCARVEDRHGAPVAWLLGIAIDARGRSLRSGARLETGADDPDFPAQMDAFVEGCAGRYVVVVLTQGTQRLYLDPVGDLAAVYHPEMRAVGSTTTLVMDRDFIDNPAFPYARVRTGELAYALGHTRDRDVKRLLAGHYLDLARSTPVRHWPKLGTDLATRRSDADIRAVNDKITERLREVVCALLRTERCIFPLSGGRDSRCLLGAALPEITRAEFLFSWAYHRNSKRDSRVAAQICETLSLPHRRFGPVKLTREARLRYLLRNGYALFGTALESLAISESLPGGHVLLRGNVMGLLRATNWQRQREGHLNLPHALKRLRSGLVGAERLAVFSDAFIAYYDRLPAAAQAKVYDFLWTDIVLTHGQGARGYGLPQNFYLNPFNDRLLLQLSVQLPVDYRMSNAAYDRIVATTLPQTLHIPYV